jgi:beta-phosphoglucomutase-like phosphatase (HAD superfamily)
MLKAIVLDIDGVVTNLDIFQYISWKSVFSQLGLNLTPKI